MTRGVTYSSSVFLALGTLELATYKVRKTWGAQVRLTIVALVVFIIVVVLVVVSQVPT